MKFLTMKFSLASCHFLPLKLYAVVNLLVYFQNYLIVLAHPSICYLSACLSVCLQEKGPIAIKLSRTDLY
jgi:hypothetical protein